MIRLAAFALALALLVYGQLRIYGNVIARESPPAACQLLGGTWGIWDGWRCD